MFNTRDISTCIYPRVQQAFVSSLIFTNTIYKSILPNPPGYRTFCMISSILEDDIKTNFRCVVFEAMDWIQIVHERVQLQNSVNLDMDFYVPLHNSVYWQGE